MNEIFKKLKDKWAITSNWQFFVINVVFALAGMTVVLERRFVFDIFGITQWALWVKIFIYLPLIFPLYQLNLIIFGTLLGQFSFFWEKEKQLMLLMKKVLARVTLKDV